MRMGGMGGRGSMGMFQTHSLHYYQQLHTVYEQTTPRVHMRLYTIDITIIISVFLLLSFYYCYYYCYHYSVHTYISSLYPRINEF